MIHIKPPTELLKDPTRYDIFLAGSIEQGKAEEWQKAFYEEIYKMRPKPNVAMFNPRRDDWDPNWDAIKDKKKLEEQIEWELEHLEKANLIVMYLQPGTISPVSLLELGLFAREVYVMKKQMIVLCPEGFHRKTNIDVVCQYYDITMAKDMNDLIKKTKACIKEFHSAMPLPNIQEEIKEADSKEKEMFEKSFKRPKNYFKLSPERQWEIDEELGILDWQGGNLTKEEQKRFQQHYKK